VTAWLADAQDGSESLDSQPDTLPPGAHAQPTKSAQGLEAAEI
jgi:hypothetical protein